MRGGNGAFRKLAAAGSVVFAIACSASAQESIGLAPSELRGTSWRWLGFTSSAESLVVDQPERYTLAFTEEGRIVLRADCNRGSGSVASPSSGALVIGALAMTRAKCPPDSLSERFARDVSRAVRYALRGGELHLELPDGSGVMRFTKAS
jgi:para-nitrobenzyl esterase